MNITLIVTLCHTLAVASPTSTCRQEVIAQSDTIGLLGCGVAAQPIVAEWKAQTIYRDPEWKVASIKCAIGNVAPKGAI
ncbi:hypothetical protein [Bradyrhizobium sp. Tv2a-2]|uniref:hypothetical protein n=1 Tax=Bradyrhizobium sp. Tv2a-2 TaxID=113395 RepID=UPI00040AB35A|nr:hypothetical protein [Bradyrhizobium sp. Tv2a-2]